RTSQSGHIGANRRGFLPSAALQIVVDDIAAVVELPRQQVLEGAGPDRAHEQILAEGRDDLVGLEAGLVAGRKHVVFEDRFKPVAPWLARRPFHQPLEQMLARHIPAPPWDRRPRSVALLYRSNDGLQSLAAKSTGAGQRRSGS